VVINHETGPQQSIDMQGCEINSWPLPHELDAVRR
jgi:hypothetical protein